MNRRRTTLAAAILAAGIGIAWMLRSGDGQAPVHASGTPPVAPAASADPASVAEVGAVPKAATPARTEAAAAASVPEASRATLTILLEDEAGERLPGTVRLTTGAAADNLPRLGPAVPWQRHLPAAPCGVSEHAASAGSVRVTVPASEPCWIAATAAREPARAQYVRIDRCDGDREVRFVFDASATRRVHVVVLDPALDGPAPECAVELRSLSDHSVLWQGRTDTSGYALATTAATGRITAVVAGAPANDPDARAGVDLDRECGDLIVVLAAPEPHVACTFAFDSAVQLWTGAPPPAVIVTRVDGRRQCVRLLTAALPRGPSEHQVDLPPGDYAIVPLPQGCARFANGQDLAQVRDEPARFAVRLEATPALRIEVAGVADGDLPVQVRTYALDDVTEAAEDRIWIGPPQWRRRRATASGWPGLAHLVAEGRSGTWMSAGRIAADASAGIVGPVAMHAAARIEVLAPVEFGRGGELVAEATAGAVSCARVMRCQLVATQHGRQPRLRAVLFVPAGDVTVTVRGTGGTAALARSLHANGRALVELP